MYKEHFGLSQDPFSIAPDPNFLFLSNAHNEALAHLMYGFSHGGFVLITGEVGTGKTTLLRNLIKRVPPELDVAFILNPRLTVRELLETVCDELAVRYQPGELHSVKQYIDALNKHLLKTHQSGRSTVVIIDEAQNLSPAVLEQIRLLTNLETNEKKLLRIILLGQPELADMLSKSELRQLAQRITARYHLTALKKEDVREYVNHRLARAGGNPGIFSDAAVRALYRHSKGIPRLINVIADRALLGAYVEGRLQIEPALVRRSAQEVLGNQGTLNRNYYLTASALVACIGALMLWAYFSQNTDDAQSRNTNVFIETKNSPSEITRPQPGAPPVENKQEGQNEVLIAQTPRTTPVPTDKDTLALKSGLDMPTSEPRNHRLTKIVRPPISSFLSQRIAYRAIYAAWQADYPTQSQLIPCDFAPLVGLQCLGRRGGWSELKQLNTPVVLELWDEENTPYYAALLAYEKDLFEIEVAGNRIFLNRQDLRDTWFGAYVLLWQTPPNYMGSLREGDTHSTVAWLRSNLRVLIENQPGSIKALLPTGDAQYFDKNLSEVILAFQVQHGLLADGIVGPLTWIKLSAQFKQPAPKLNQGSN